MKSTFAHVAAFAIGCFALVPGASSSEVVYDSLPGSFGGSALAIEVGQSIELAGSARTITQIDLRMGSSNDLEVFWVRFYNVDSNNLPQDLLWESQLQAWTDDTPFYATHVVSVDVPNIVVPDRFAWTTRRILPSQLSQSASQTTTTGTFLTGFYLDPLAGSGWFQVDGAFGARVIAIPEPGTLFLVVAGIVLLAIRRR